MRHILNIMDVLNPQLNQRDDPQTLKEQLLRIIVVCETLEEADDEQDDRRGNQPRQQARHQPKEPRRIGEVDEGHGRRFSPGWIRGQSGAARRSFQAEA